MIIRRTIRALRKLTTALMSPRVLARPPPGEGGGREDVRPRAPRARRERRAWRPRSGRSPARDAGAGLPHGPTSGAGGDECSTRNVSARASGRTRSSRSSGSAFPCVLTFSRERRTTEPAAASRACRSRWVVQATAVRSAVFRRERFVLRRPLDRHDEANVLARSTNLGKRTGAQDTPDRQTLAATPAHNCCNRRVPSINCVTQKRGRKPFRQYRNVVSCGCCALPLNAWIGSYRERHRRSQRCRNAVPPTKQRSYEEVHE